MVTRCMRPERLRCLLCGNCSQKFKTLSCLPPQEKTIYSSLVSTKRAFLGSLAGSGISLRPVKLSQRSIFTPRSLKTQELSYGNIDVTNDATTMNTMTESQKDKVQRILEDIRLHLGSESNNEKYSASFESYLPETVLLLLRNKASPGQITYCLSRNPKLLTQPTDAWSIAIKAGVDMAFKTSEILPIVSELSDLFTGRSLQLENVIEALRAIGFHDRQPNKILLIHPALLSQKPKKIIGTHHELLLLFPKSDLAKMILRTPRVLTLDPSEINEKFVYAQEVMGVDAKYLSRSDFLSRDLLSLETRHAFLSRAGLYEKPDKRGATRVENPTFWNIADTDDRYFAVRVAKMTVAEYRAFCELYRMEKKRLRDMEDGFISDEDSDYCDYESDR